jgi:hypothetical protein
VVDQLRTFGSQLSTPCPETRALIRQLLQGRSELDARRALSLPVRLLELAEQHDTARAHTAAQLDPLLDAVIASGSPLGAVLAEQRTEIARAFRRVDLAHMTSGLRALSAWLAAPARDGAALAAQLRDQLAEALGPPTMPEPVARTPSLSEFAQFVS